MIRQLKTESGKIIELFSGFFFLEDLKDSTEFIYFLFRLCEQDFTFLSLECAQFEVVVCDFFVLSVGRPFSFNMFFQIELHTFYFWRNLLPAIGNMDSNTLNFLFRYCQLLHKNLLKYTLIHTCLKPLWQATMCDPVWILFSLQH